MAILSSPAFGPRAALMYITTGCLIDVWVAVWYFAFIRGENNTPSNTVWFWLMGLFFTGITFLIIGLRLGQIGQSARRAELPPTEVMDTDARIQTAAAQAPHLVAPQAAPVVAAPAPPPVPGAAPAHAAAPVVPQTQPPPAQGNPAQPAGTRV